MKILKILAIIVGIIIAIPLLLALFVASDYSVQRDVVIDRPVEDVFDYVKYLRNQDEFSKWASMDPDMRTEYRGEDATPGFVSAWDSDDENVGAGEQEILSIVDGERIDYELRFLRPWESTSTAWMTTEALSDSSTRVTWGFSGAMGYPMNLMLLFMDMELMIGDDLQTGLNNLRRILEN
jgi:uncharacterized protein YndB with AHSA1/START domain